MKRPSIHGFHDIGRIRIPPIPNFIAMVDRETGAVWRLSHTEGVGEIELVSDPWRWPDVTRYGPEDGPYVSNHRLFVSNGTLSFEPVEGDTTYANSRVTTRRVFERLLGEITIVNDTITLTPIQL